MASNISTLEAYGTMKHWNVGDILNSRFELLTLLGQGAFGTVWRALDLETRRQCVLKLYPSSAPSALLPQYREHLQTIQKKLSPLHVPSLDIPYEFGEFDEWQYQVSAYHENLQGLDQVLSTAGPLHPRDALNILSKIADAVGALHSHGVIHADLKPANILVSDAIDREVRIIDFGMVQRSKSDDSFLVFGTYFYMPPELAASTREIDASGTAIMRLRTAAIGPYIDLYATGVLFLELLTATPSLPRPLSQTSISAWLKIRNPWLAVADDPKIAAVANLAKELLTVGPRDEAGISSTIALLSKSLFSMFPEDAPRTDLVSLPAVEPDRKKAPPEVTSALTRIAALGRQLAEETAAFIVKSGTVESIPDPNEDQRILEVVSTVFHNAMQRARTGWRLGIAMTVASFALLVSMIVSAITLTLVTGESQWALIFGGIGVSTVIGTLIWRPYDRLFRATILTQQIEIIHIQTIVGIRGTVGAHERVRVCRDAVAALTALLDPGEGGRRE